MLCGLLTNVECSYQAQEEETVPIIESMIQLGTLWCRVDLQSTFVTHLCV